MKKKYERMEFMDKAIVMAAMIFDLLSRFVFV